MRRLFGNNNKGEGATWQFLIGFQKGVFKAFLSFVKRPFKGFLSFSKRLLKGNDKETVI